MPPAIDVLTIGPSPLLMGGMSAVVKQMGQLDFAGRYKITYLPFTMAPTSEESRPRRVLRHIKQRLLLGQMLRDGGYGIAHIHTCSGFSFHRSAWDLRVARRKGLRAVLHMHGAQFDEYFANASQAEQGLVRRTLRLAHRVIALSQGWLERLRTIEPNSRITVIENAVSVPLQISPRAMNKVCRFLMLARMDAWKGVDDLIEACTLMRKCGVPFTLTLAGPEGSAGDASELGRKIHENQLRSQVRYVGPVEGEAKEILLAGSDVLVQPSHQEGMPISILEAFAQGLAVVATRVGAVPEVLEHEVQGLLVPAKNPCELARAMSLVAIDTPRRRAMGEAGRRTAEMRYSLTRFRDDLADLYGDLLREARRPANAMKSAGPLRC